MRKEGCCRHHYVIELVKHSVVTDVGKGTKSFLELVNKFMGKVLFLMNRLLFEFRNNEVECDDGNIVDGDGCSLDCKVEDFYDCKGRT